MPLRRKMGTPWDVANAALFLALERLGHAHHALYDGSWTEWGNTVGVPIEKGAGQPAAPPAPAVPPAFPGAAGQREPRVEAPATTSTDKRVDRIADPSPTGSIAAESRGSILPPVPPRGVKLMNVPPPPVGAPQISRPQP